ncbi:MAG: hypothetical protein MK165_04810 [Pirellulaceae bacterium]|nr:hypothetical protein [Pirellulaceae bacterium]
MIKNYFNQLIGAVGSTWNRFWFTSSDPLTLCVIRILTGIVAIIYHLSHSWDLTRWFGLHGLLPIDTVHRLTGAANDSVFDQQFVVAHISLLNQFDDVANLWTVHIFGLAILLAFTLGLWTRITTILSLTVILTYIHRAPMITGHVEPILSMLLLYLCIAPCGTYLSLDRIRARKKQSVTTEIPSSISATVSMRFIQVHLAALYFIMALSKLAGDTWWAGEAVWWLIARSETRLIDLTFLSDLPAYYVVNAWTHLIVFFELSFALLVWYRIARPLLLGIALLMWTTLALLTGALLFCLAMMVANLVFVQSTTWRRYLNNPLDSPTTLAT